MRKTALSLLLNLFLVTAFCVNVQALKSKGYEEGKDFVFVHNPTAQHFEADWAKRFPSALMLVLQKAAGRE